LRLVVGLGNPGPLYAKTRHNFGYWAVDALAASRNVLFTPGKGDYVMAVQTTEDLVFIKPTGFMNECGLSVRGAIRFFQAAPEDTLVIFDDVDLPLGTLRFRPRGSDSGHKGVSSIIYHLATEDFPRLRLGIATDAPMRPSEKYVLEPFRAQDEPVVGIVLEKAAEGINYYLRHGMEETMARYNTRLTSSTMDEGEV
jgi:PTH1 family peptidyl-tRNA hydrolase